MVMQDLLQLSLWVLGLGVGFGCRILCLEFLGPGSVVWEFAIWFVGKGITSGCRMDPKP